jgi:hypothetical protein
MRFNFEMQQPMKFSVYDDDGSGSKELIGETEVMLSHIMGSRNQQHLADLTKKS